MNNHTANKVAIKNGEDLKYIDASSDSEVPQSSVSKKRSFEQTTSSPVVKDQKVILILNILLLNDFEFQNQDYYNNVRMQTISKTVVTTSDTKSKEETSPRVFRKKSLANTSGASMLHTGKMSLKDRRLLKMILVIFCSFVTCYLPITACKLSSSLANVQYIFIASYLLIYLTTCLNPLIYVLMSKEYRKAYLLLLCRFFCVQCG